MDASVRANVAEVEGNVMVVPSLPVRVRIFETFSDLPLATVTAWYEAFQAAAVLTEVETTVKTADVPPASTVTVLPPEDCAVTAPVLLLVIENCWPSTSVEVAGNATVCVVMPVKYC